MDGGHTTEALAFAAPGPGTWLLDGVHMPRPFSRFQQAIHPPGIAAGCPTASAATASSSIISTTGS